jgi:hypothetical protein
MSEFALDAYLDMPDDGTPLPILEHLEPPLTRFVLLRHGTPRSRLPDDMPPLVDRPVMLDLLPPPPPLTMAMMSYSFDADFTPIPYSPDSPLTDMPPEPSAQRFELISEEDAPRISATKPSHAKKRDAGHIPRPPNAFILFRSSFIKSESVPGNIEGNHSTLSKIIGTSPFPPSLSSFLDLTSSAPPHRNRMEDAPARRTRTVGEACRAGPGRAPRAISGLALPAWHERRRHREAQDQRQE